VAKKKETRAVLFWGKQGPRFRDQASFRTARDSHLSSFWARVYHKSATTRGSSW